MLERTEAGGSGKERKGSRLPPFPGWCGRERDTTWGVGFLTILGQGLYDSAMGIF